MLLPCAVVPTGVDHGLVQWVEDAQTVFHIQQRQNLLNYLCDCNGKRTVDQMQLQYLRSFAAYTVITFLLGPFFAGVFVSACNFVGNRCVRW